MNLKLFLIVAFISNTAFSQIKTGIVLSSQDKAPVTYCNIYSKNSAVGTITNDEGYFKLNFTTPLDSIIISHLGYEKIGYPINNFFEHGDTIYLTPKVVQLNEVTIFGGDPKQIITKAIKKLSSNYPNEPNTIKAHFRSIIKENEEYVFFTEGAALVQNASYLSSKNQVSKVRVYDIRSSTNKSETFTSYKASLENTINAIDFFKNKPFLSKDLDYYVFKVEKIIPYNNNTAYVIKFEPKPNLKRKYLFSGTLFIESTSNAFIRMEYTIALVEKFTFTRYKGLDNEFNQTFLTDKYEVQFRPFQNKWTLVYATTETFSTINFIKDKREIKMTTINELLNSEEQRANSQSIEDTKTITINEDIHKYSEFFDESMWVKFNQILPNKKLRGLMSAPKNN